MTTPLPAQRTGPARSRIYNAALRLFAENGGSAVTVSGLADAAGIARGTIYNNVDEPRNLLGEVAAALSREMLLRTEATMRGFADPAARIATGLRLFVRRASEDRDWGRFMVQFSLSHVALRGIMHGPPSRDIAHAIEAGRFKFAAAQATAFLTMLSGTTIAAMNAVIRGEQTWRDAGSDAAELVLRAAGIPAAEARRIATSELAPLAAEQKRARRTRRKR
ncbi:MAG: TetR/AcrR family transcriptional regulator [Alphaproteobacteria bacterium]|nr:TetR/AcrR family transcriptional regulator [Alphaproteobacteria bacterium]